MEVDLNEVIPFISLVCERKQESMNGITSLTANLRHKFMHAFPTMWYILESLLLVNLAKKSTYNKKKIIN